MTSRLIGWIAALAIALVVGPASPALAQSPWNSVVLTWTSPGDDSLSGTAAQYDLRWATAPINAANFAQATAVTGLPAPAPAGTSQSFTVTGLQPSTTYWFAIKTVDDAGNWSLISNVVSKSTSSAPDAVRPAPMAIGVTALTDSTATLSWTAVGDDSLTGTVAAWDVRYSTSPITEGNWGAATQASGEPAPTAPGTTQTFVVRGLARQVTYHFAARARDESGNQSALSNVPSATTPDTMKPADIRNLALGLLWSAWTAGGGR